MGAGFVPRGTFDPYVANPYAFTEGNAWQWQWAFMQDLDKLTDIMGGTQGLNDKLNNLFNADSSQGDQHQDMTGYIGQYIHGNEPSHHVIYLYNRTEESYKAQEYLDQVYDQFYKPTPDGIIGNEDVGQMSAWYLMSALASTRSRRLTQRTPLAVQSSTRLSCRLVKALSTLSRKTMVRIIST